MSSDSFVVCATVNRPRRSAAGSACGILFDIVEESGLATDLSPLILEHAPGLFLSLLTEVAEGRSLRIDLAEVKDRPGALPQYSRSAEVAAVGRDLVRQLTGRSGAQLYPVSIWAIPPNNSMQSIAAIEKFREDRSSAALFSDIMLQGVVLFAIFPSSLTISVEGGRLDQTLSRVRNATTISDLPIEWA